MDLVPLTTAIAGLAIAPENAPNGLAIALSGMLIVGSALLLICLFITMLPRVLTVVESYWPEVHERHGGSSHPESHVPDDEMVLAAIGFVLHQEFQRQLQLETSKV